MIRWIFLIGMFVLAACGHHAPVPGEGPDQEHSLVAAPVLPTPLPSPSEAPAATLGRPDCPKPAAMAPRALATGWPALVGRRVRLRMVPLRAIGMTEWLVVAGGQRFVVLAPPDTSWNSEHVFLVSGTTLAPVHGRTSLPELVLDRGCDT